ncbi:asparagine synthase C-terminal domain-containing protein, partial [Cyanobium sp. To12R1]|uniref:asparagine synthase-related protein n=1 Tax=Cyanobium sp. To12R1 TaxID=2823723 RepID=UPI0020CE2FAE
WVTRADFAAARDDVMASMDQPTIDGVNTYFVSRAATAAGLKVALSGVGGDELLGGYPSFAQVPTLARRVGALPGAAVWGRGLRTLGAPLLSRLTSPKAAGLFEYGGTYGGSYLLRRGLFMPWEIPGIVGRDLARAGWDALQTSGRLATSVAGLDSPVLRVTALESTWYMRHQLLRDTDWASMAHSIEIRTPLVDHTLLQQVAPLRARHHGAVTKRAMARVPRPGLPDAILDRPKTGFTIPVREWLLADTPDAAERGYRGWARWVYRHHLDAVAA